MAHTLENVQSLTTSMKEFSDTLPLEQRKILDDLILASAKAINVGEGQSDILEGATSQLSRLATTSIANSDNTTAGTAITTITVTTALQSSRWLC